MLNKNRVIRQGGFAKKMGLAMGSLSFINKNSVIFITILIQMHATLKFVAAWDVMFVTK